MKYTVPAVRPVREMVKDSVPVPLMVLLSLISGVPVVFQQTP